jgi:hypothetical protein
MPRDPIEQGETPVGKGRKEAVFDPPSKWAADEQGRPVCLPSPPGGAWLAVAHDYHWVGGRKVYEHGPSAFPTFGGRDGHHGYGRPRLQDRDPERVRYVAWRVDVRGSSRRQVARDLYGDGGDASRLRVGRELKAGRALLHAEGVLPWAAWPADKLPAEWWREERFWRAVNRWARETMLRNIREAWLAPVRAVLGHSGVDQSAGQEAEAPPR